MNNDKLTERAIVCVAFGVLGTVSAVVGVWMRFGIDWALIVLGALFLAVATLGSEK